MVRKISLLAVVSVPRPKNSLIYTQYIDTLGEWSTVRPVVPIATFLKSSVQPHQFVNIVEELGLCFKSFGKVYKCRKYCILLATPNNTRALSAYVQNLAQYVRKGCH